MSVNNFLSRARISIIPLALFALATTSCLHFLAEGKGRLLADNMPPSFEFRGRGKLMWIWVQGPYPAGPDSPSTTSVPTTDPVKTIIWKISPPQGRFVPLNEVPSVKYSQVPPGWVQEFPEIGSPPPLVEGGVYTVTAVTARNQNIRVCLVVSGGKARENPQSDLCQTE